MWEGGLVTDNIAVELTIINNHAREGLRILFGDKKGQRGVSSSRYPNAACIKVTLNEYLEGCKVLFRARVDACLNMFVWVDKIH